MQYNGGKNKIAKEIAALINKQKPTSYWEPFCGACSVALLVESDIIHCSDADLSVVSLLEGVKEGWEPPNEVSEFEYQRSKTLLDSAPLKGFCKFGCSFGGKPWGGYARSGNRNYALNAKNSLLQIKEKLQNIIFANMSYDMPQKNKYEVIYCDPPYRGTTKVGNGQTFDSDKFYDWVRKTIATTGALILISEYNMPEDFVCIWSKETNGDLGHKKQIEKLWVHRSQV